MGKVVIIVVFDELCKINESDEFVGCIVECFFESFDQFFICFVEVVIVLLRQQLVSMVYIFKLSVVMMGGVEVVEFCWQFEVEVCGDVVEDDVLCELVFQIEEKVRVL